MRVCVVFEYRSMPCEPCPRSVSMLCFASTAPDYSLKPRPWLFRGAAIVWGSSMVGSCCVTKFDNSPG